MKRHIAKAHTQCNLKAHTKCNECDLIAQSLNSLYARAEEDFASSLDIEKHLLPRDSRSVASSLYQLGLAQAYSGKLLEAEANLQAAIRNLEAGGEDMTLDLEDGGDCAIKVEKFNSGAMEAVSKLVAKVEKSKRVAMEEINLEISLTV